MGQAQQAAITAAAAGAAAAGCAQPNPRSHRRCVSKYIVPDLALTQLVRGAQGEPLARLGALA